MDEYYDDEYYDEPERPAGGGFLAPALTAVVAAIAAFGVYALLFGNFGGDDIDVAASEQPTVTVENTPAPQIDPNTPVGTATDPATGGQPAGTPAAGTDAAAAPATQTPAGGPSEAPGQIGAGTSVQVLAGSNTSNAQLNAAVNVLRDMGYNVTESGRSRNPYPETTVFATAGEDATAQLLVDTDSRFTKIGVNPGNLTNTIQIHVLVGENWPTQ